LPASNQKRGATFKDPPHGAEGPGTQGVEKSHGSIILAENSCEFLCSMDWFRGKVTRKPLYLIEW